MSVLELRSPASDSWLLFLELMRSYLDAIVYVVASRIVTCRRRLLR